MYSGHTSPPKVQFDQETRERIIGRESQCSERAYVKLSAARVAYKSALPRNEFMAQAIDRHESECYLCQQEVVLDPDFCRHGAEWGECVECGMERINL